MPHHAPNPPFHDDDSTVASSTMATISSSQWKTMFPPNKVPAKFNYKVETFIKDVLGCPEVLRMRLFQVGLVTPQVLINAFGMNDSDIICNFL